MGLYEQHDIKGRANRGRESGSYCQKAEHPLRSLIVAFEYRLWQSLEYDGISEDMRSEKERSWEEGDPRKVRGKES